MRIGVAATPDVAIPTLDWLITSEHDLVLVITQPDKPAGRGRAIKQSVVGDWAASRGIPIIKPESSDDLIGVINDLDCVVTIGYGVLLPENILELPKNGFINLHFSLLPAYRGAAPAQRALQCNPSKNREGGEVLALGGRRFVNRHNNQPKVGGSDSGDDRGEAR